MHSFERALLRRYLFSLARSKDANWNVVWRESNLPEWVEHFSAALGLSKVLPFDRSELRDAATRDTVRAHLLFCGTPQLGTPSALERRLVWIGDHLGLSPADWRIFGALVRMGSSVPFHSLASALRFNFDPQEIEAAVAADDVPLSVIAGVLDMAPSALGRHLGCSSPLRILGLVEDRRARDYAASTVALRLASATRLDQERVRESVFGKPRKSILAWNDFAHIEPEASVVRGLVEAAAAAREPGVNILLYGPPGVGKSEFASVLAAQAGLHALFVGESDDDGDEPSRDTRISALALAQKLSSCAEQLLLVVDEADDLFVGVDDAVGMNRKGAKVFMNRLVEKTPVPTVYICNDPRMLGPAVLRRMTYALRFPEPDMKARERLVRAIATHRRVKLPDQGVRLLASVRAPAAVIDHGLHVARLCGGGAEAACGAAQSILRAMGRASAEPAQGELPFVDGLCCADHDVASLARLIVASGRMDVSLCLSGPPGTGKSAFARHLAHSMGLEVVQKRASDLLGMFVGETEEKIADAFREAERQKAFLIFDEADSLLQDRSGAARAYEVSQVNEMLTWMERHPYPFACTTNLPESLDPAAARRFVFKVRFLALGAQQIREAFRRTFGLEAPVRLLRAEQLTPGDFAVVARRAAVLGEHSADRLADALLAEEAAKPSSVVRGIGFRAVI